MFGLFIRSILKSMELSFTEILIIGLIAFLVLGPKEMIIMAEKIGSYIRKIRMEVDRFKEMARKEVLEDESVKRLQHDLTEAQNKFNNAKTALEIEIQNKEKHFQEVLKLNEPNQGDSDDERNSRE